MSPTRFGAHRLGSPGMVLIEVMVALAIFTAVAFGLVMALNASMEVARERNQIDLVITGLQNQMALLEKGRLVTGSRDLPDDGTGVTYQLDVEIEQMKDQAGALVPNVYRATLSASWKMDRETDERTVTELIFQP